MLLVPVLVVSSLVVSKGLKDSPEQNTTPSSTESGSSGSNDPQQPSSQNQDSGDSTSRRATVEDIPRLTASKDAKTLYNAILACFPEDKSEFFDRFEQAPCYEKLVIEAALNISPVDVLNAMKALVAARPDVLSACHNGGHSAASTLTKRFWDPKQSYEEQLKQMRFVMQDAPDVCQNGYIHGFYDAIGQNNPNEDSFKAAGQVCYDFENSNDCGHGLGHSIWYATKDLKKAAALCGVFEDAYKYRCDDGIIMYVPDLWTAEYSAQGKSGWAGDPKSPMWNADKYYKDALELCSAIWPKERPGDPTPLRGCWEGIVSGILWRPMTLMLEHGDYEEGAEIIKDLAPRAEDVCIKLKEGFESCFSEWGGLVVYVAQNIPENIKDICSSLKVHKERCLKDSLDQLVENEDRDTELSRYERDEQPSK